MSADEDRGSRQWGAAPESTLNLLGRIREGDESALDLLYERYVERLQRWAHYRLPRWARDLMDTDDLVQETLLKTLRGVKRFDPEHSGAFQAYLRRAVRNRIQDEIRRVSRRPQVGDAETNVHDPSPSPLEEAIGREVLVGYETALESLNPADREAVVGRVELGFSYKDLAAVLGKPTPDAARMAVKRALLKLASGMAHGT